MRAARCPLRPLAARNANAASKPRSCTGARHFSAPSPLFRWHLAPLQSPIRPTTSQQQVSNSCRLNKPPPLPPSQPPRLAPKQPWCPRSAWSRRCRPCGRGPRRRLSSSATLARPRSSSRSGSIAPLATLPAVRARRQGGGGGAGGHVASCRRATSRRRRRRPCFRCLRAAGACAAHPSRLLPLPPAQALGARERVWTTPRAFLPRSRRPQEAPACASPSWPLASCAGAWGGCEVLGGPAVKKG